jgi:hypothetical protein
MVLKANENGKIYNDNWYYGSFDGSNFAVYALDAELVWKVTRKYSD